MTWHEKYSASNEPSAAQIEMFAATPLWRDLTRHLQQSCKVQPKLFYSRCSMDKDFWKGWHVKYQKRGRSLCTLYPKAGYFMALIPIGAKEIAEADLLIPFCELSTQELYHQTKYGTYGKSLPVAVTNEQILRDVKSLVALRDTSRKNEQ